MPNYLALKYVVSSAGASLRTFRAVLVLLDEIARLKGTDALVCDASNLRISDRLLARWGWQPLAARPWHRNYVKRFYGDWPLSEEARELCGLPPLDDDGARCRPSRLRLVSAAADEALL
jgi:hypothetical protein